MVRHAAGTGTGPDERRRVLEVSVALSEVKVLSSAFFDSLARRDLAGSSLSSRATTRGCAPRTEPSSAGPSGSAVKFHLAQNAAHHAPNTAIHAGIGPSCAPCGMPALSPRPRSLWPNWWPATGAARPSWPLGSSKTGSKASAFSPCLNIIAAACASQTRSSARFSRNSNGAPSRSGPSPAKTLCCAWSPPSSSKSTGTGPPITRGISSGNARMHAPLPAEFPDNSLRMPAAWEIGNNKPHPRKSPQGRQQVILPTKMGRIMSISDHCQDRTLEHSH